MLRIKHIRLFFTVLTTLFAGVVVAQVTLDTVGNGWANNSVNAVIFRKNSLVSFKDTQYIAYYDIDRYVILGKRKTGSKNWEIKRTQFQGNAADAHNTISIMADGNNYLHISWDHHGHPLRYAKSVTPGSLVLTEKLPMTGSREGNVTYPEFHRMPNGNLLFFYRDGSSGKGNMVINSYDITTAKWTQLHSNLIDGEGKRNAYCQAFVDIKGIVHVSWVWRESPDVASNHDMCYARSLDGGVSWEKTSGEKYRLPIVAGTAEYAWKIPQNSELINQTSMYAGENGEPFIATYWREADSKVPQYHLVFFNNKKWQVSDLGFRKTAFSLSGVGTKRIPVSRPQIIAWKKGNKIAAAFIFRDEERSEKVSVAVTKNILKPVWKITDLTSFSVGSWEPSYDTELWKTRKVLDLFVQNVQQVDGEGKANIPPQPVQVLEWKP